MNTSAIKLAINEVVPFFEAPLTSGKTFQWADFKGKQQVVLYFYPKDHTPGCTTEGLDFSASYPAFLAADTEVIGVSRDSLRTHENFKTKQQFPFELLSDTDEQVCQLFDVIKMKNMYGRQVRGIERSTFLIDKQGILRAEWRKVRVKNHVAAVLEVAQSLI